MTASRPDNEAIFHAARDIHDPDRRRGYIRQACGGDEARIAHVEALLAAADAPDSLLDRPPAKDPTPTIDQPPTEIPGTTIGPYKLLQQIGEGGMGTVWMAQQTEPVKRLVAVKLIKAGMDSKAVIARFEAERQALAIMDHPNIAKVFDGGMTETAGRRLETAGNPSDLQSPAFSLQPAGRPYFVMELVKGVPITKYCDEHRLTPRQRLELFIPVCQAIQHAHQKGIIHRDLKPSNVLVAQYDGTPMPKVIDFGVAKAAGQSLTEQTLVTGFGAIVGTLEYMSPEQAEVNQLDIDTRSDIYSLGVLLYELLTGSPPFSRKELEKAGMLEMLRVIREQEPSKPSTKLSSSDALPTLSSNRGTEPAKLTRLVRGELDWIVMKALEKDRNRRYETANGFAMDVQRYLADEAVLACPPSVGYRFRKFARRNKVGLAIAGLVLVFLIVLGGGISWMARSRAARQRKAAHDFELTLDRAESLEVQGKQAQAMATLDHAEALASEVPFEPARNARLAALKERLGAKARDQVFIVEFEAIRLRAANQVDVAQGRFVHEAVVLEFREALRCYGIHVGVMEPAQAAAYLQSRPESVRQDLIAALDECLRWAEPGDAPTRQWLLAVLTTADNDAWRARVRQAESGHDWQALEPLVRAADERKQPPSFLLGVATGLPLQMRATQLDLLRRIQRSYPADVWANHWLAYALVSRHGLPAEAIRYFTVVVAMRPNSPGPYVNRGSALIATKELDAAIADFRQALTLAPQYGKAHYNLGLVLHLRGQMEAAIVEYREAINLNKNDDRAHYNLGLALKRIGHLDEAIEEYREAIGIQKDKAEAHCELGNALRQRGEFREALEAMRRGHELGSKDPHWRYDSAQWVRQCERLVELEGLLPSFLLGNASPSSPGERIELAGLCSLKRLHRAATQFYEDAFAAQPELAGGLGLNHRYKAACAAALAGCGQGKDAHELESMERARLRRQALVWLCADLAASKHLFDTHPDQTGSVAKVIEHWRLCLTSPDFEGVRGAEPLAKLPEAERQSWQHLWRDVADTLAHSQKKSAPRK